MSRLVQSTLWLLVEMSRLAQSTLFYYFHSSVINVSLVVSYRSTPGRQCACLVPRPRGGGRAGVRVCHHRPCTPRAGNLYSVTRTPESPGVRATECKSLVAHKVLLDSILLLLTAPFPAEQCACLSVYLYGSAAEGAVGVRVSDPVTPRMSWGTPHGRTVAPKMIKLRRSCFRLASSSWSSWSSALGSGFRPVGVRVPAGGGWVSCAALRGRDET